MEGSFPRTSRACGGCGNERKSIPDKGPCMVKGLKGKNDVSPEGRRRSVLFKSSEAEVGSVGSKESRRQQGGPYQEGLPSKQGTFRVIGPIPKTKGKHRGV